MKMNAENQELNERLRIYFLLLEQQATLEAEITRVQGELKKDIPAGKFYIYEGKQIYHKKFGCPTFKSGLLKSADIETYNKYLVNQERDFIQVTEIKVDTKKKK